MTCTDLERDVALYAGGDLEDADMVENHLADCQGCRAMLEELQGLRGELAGLRDVALPQVSVPRPRPVRVWTWAAGAVAAGMLLLLIPKPAEVAPPPRMVWVAPGPVIELKPLAHARGSEARRVAVQKVAPDTEFVKILTDDEDVVILWAMNTKGDLR